MDVQVRATQDAKAEEQLPREDLIAFNLIHSQYIGEQCGPFN